MKLSIPRHRVSDIEVGYERDHVHHNCIYSDDYPLYSTHIKTNKLARINISIEMNNRQEEEFVLNLRHYGLDFVSDNGFQFEKFRWVINQGYQKLPILLKHPDKDISDFAWMLSKYFSKRDEIMPKEIM
jgi:hypothetical protein